MNDYTTSIDCQVSKDVTEEYSTYDLSDWRSIKEFVPVLAKRFLVEYDLYQGRTPYDPGYVYLMHGKGTNFYKIGKSNSPNRRLGEVSPKMPFEARLIHVWPSDFMSIAERWMHSHFAEYRANGEWFKLPDGHLYHLLVDFYEEYSCAIASAWAIEVFERLATTKKDSNWLSEQIQLNSLQFHGINEFSINKYSVAWIEHIFQEIEMDRRKPQIPEDLIDYLKLEEKRRILEILASECVANGDVPF